MMTEQIVGATVVPFRRVAVHEPWLSKRQIADYLGRSTRWVELRVREGLPSKMIGGRRGFRLSEVEAWIDGRNR
jgi:predicted DNA-binding transcriptional regulator AlpA